MAAGDKISLLLTVVGLVFWVIALGGVVSAPHRMGRAGRLARWIAAEVLEV